MEILLVYTGGLLSFFCVILHVVQFQFSLDNKGIYYAPFQSLDFVGY